MLPLARYVLVGWLLLVSSASAQSASVVVISPEKIEFPAQSVANSGPSQTLTLTNSSSTAIPLRGILVSGIDYSQTNDCGEKLEAGAKCTVSITFKPASTGNRLGALQLNWSGAGSPRTIPLTGLGQ
jgi:hypothetical protein